MPTLSKEKFDEVIKCCLAKYCDRKIADTTENVDPEGYNKVRTVIWYFKPYTFKAGYLFGGDEKLPTFAPLGISKKLDGSAEEEKLKTTGDLVETIGKANLMREAGIV